MHSEWSPESTLIRSMTPEAGGYFVAENTAFRQWLSNWRRAVFRIIAGERASFPDVEGVPIPAPGPSAWSGDIAADAEWHAGRARTSPTPALIAPPPHARKPGSPRDDSLKPVTVFGAGCEERMRKSTMEQLEKFDDGFEKSLHLNFPRAQRHRSFKPAKSGMKFINLSAFCVSGHSRGHSHGSLRTKRG